MSVSKMETPTGQEETAILLEEYERRIATLQESLKQAGRIYPNEAVILQEIKRVVDERDDLKRRLGNAEMLIERLKREIKELDFSVALHERNAALRTAEESSVVGLIDSTPAKQPEDSANADGDGDSVIDDNPLQVELDREKRKNEDLYRDFKGANDLYLAENLRAEKFQDALLQIRHLTWKNPFLYGRKRLRELLANVFSIAYNALKVKDPIDNTTALRTAEESSVVGLIDSTPAKQPEDSANAG